MEMMIFIVSALTFLVNTASLVLSYCQYKMRAATTTNSDGSATEKQRLSLRLGVAASATLPLCLF